MTDQAEAPPAPSEAERLEGLADRCELAMIDAIERALKAEVGPVKTNARTAAAEYAIVAGTIRDRINRLNPPPQLWTPVELPPSVELVHPVREIEPIPASAPRRVKGTIEEIAAHAAPTPLDPPKIQIIKRPKAQKPEGEA